MSSESHKYEKLFQEMFPKSIIRNWAHPGPWRKHIKPEFASQYPGSDDWY